jgi:DNA-binding IclR family transcriptional regulator
MTNARLTPGVPRNQSLTRAVSILRVLSQQASPASTSQIASLVELPRPTTARLLATLADAGLAERLRPGDGWVLGYEATRLGRIADPYSVLTRHARPSLEALTAATGESSVLAVTRHPTNVDIIAQVDAPNLLGVTNWVGRSFGLHASVSGKLAYARLTGDLRDDLLRECGFERYTPTTITRRDAFERELDRVRDCGYATSVDELEMGLTLIGMDVPPDPTDASVVASVGLMGPSSRITSPYTRELDAIRACVREISQIDW